MSFMLTRIHVEDYEAWKPMFDADAPGARSRAKAHRILRSADDPNDVFIQVEFASPEDAIDARERLLASGVLDRVDVQAGPAVAEEAETVAY
jgi:hypothetical protein